MGSQEDRAWKIYLTLNVMNYKYVTSNELYYILEKHIDPLLIWSIKLLVGLTI